MAVERVPNDLLRALLAEADWTGEALARTINTIGSEAGLSLGYHRASVAHWLSGMRPRHPVPALVAEAFSRALGRRVTVPETGLDGPRVRVLPTEADRTWDAPAAEQLAELTGSDPASTVYSLAALPVSVSGEPVSDTRRERDVRAVTRVGPAEVRSARLMTKMFSDADSAFGGGFVWPALRDYLGFTITPWLRVDATPAVRRDLLVASAQLAYLCGFTCFDNRRNGAAQRYYLASLRLAADAGDAVSCSVALRALSVQACALHHYQHAVHLAEAAVNTASNRTPRRTRAFLYGQLAVALAATGDRHAALTHLATAERVLETAAGVQGLVGAYHPAALAHQHAAVRFHLGERRAAASALQYSVRQRPAGERRSQAITLARLAELQLADGQVEQACDTWHLFLDDYPQLRSRRATEAFTLLWSSTRPHQHNPVVSGLRRRAGALRAPGAGVF